MNIRYLLFLVFGLILFAACGNEQGKSNGTDDATEEFVPPTDVKEYSVTNTTCNKPTSMRELTGGIKKLYYQVTNDNQASLKLFGNPITLGKKEMMVIVDFVQHKDTDCDGEQIRYGVGARLFLHVKRAKLGAGVEVSDLPFLAASVQMGKATVKYSIETVGITGDKVLEALPKASDNNFNVDGYSQVMKAVDNIQNLARDGVAGVIIDPQVIPLD